MNTELEVLKKIFQTKNGRHPPTTHIKLISNHLGFGADYIRFICKRLEEKNLVKTFGRDWYRITPRGKRELERMGLIKKSPRKRGIKIENPVWERVQIPSTSSSKTTKLKSEFKESKEEKLKLGKKIEKTAAFLRNFKKNLIIH